MIDKVLAASIIGFSFMGMWQCLVLAFGLGTINKKTGIGFILGRALGLMLIGSLLAILGAQLSLSPRIIIIVFGALCFIFGLRMIFKKNGSNVEERGVSGFSFGLGFLKGLTPCGKVWLVFPLLLGTRIQEGLLILFALALSSSIYPLIALFFSQLIRRVYIRKTRLIGGWILIITGAFYLFKGIMKCP